MASCTSVKSMFSALATFCCAAVTTADDTVTVFSLSAFTLPSVPAKMLLTTMVVIGLAVTDSPAAGGADITVLMGKLTAGS